MTSLSHRLESAALALVGSQTIKERLFTAWSQHLADLELRDFPREVRDDFESMRSVLNRETALPGDTVLKASLRKLSSDDAQRYASLIIRTYGSVAALKLVPPSILPRATAPLPFLAELPRVAG